MGNLSNLFISASFQSLIHLGNDSVISSSLVGLQDGFGNPIGIAVNNTGDLSISGSFTSSLQQGYVWVGNANGKTTTVPTSSFGGGGSATWPVSGTPSGIVSGSSQVSYPGLSNIPSGIVSGSSQLTSSYDTRYALSGSINLTSLNSYTASNDSKWNTLATYTGSVNTQLTNLSLSQSIDNQKWINISTQSGSWGGGGGSINTGSFATTGSNQFTGSQSVTGSVYLDGLQRLYIKRANDGTQQYLRLGSTDNSYNFAFIVTGSDTNPGQQVWGINTAGGIWANSFDAGVAFNSYVSASNGIQIGRATDDQAGRNALTISKLSGQVGILINEADVTSSFFIGTRDNGNGNLIVSSSSNDRYIEFAKSSGWMEVYANQTNFNNNVAFRNRVDIRNVFTDIGLGYTAQFDTISGSNANISGSLYVGGNKQFNGGQFQNNTTLSGSSNVSQSIALPVTDSSYGVSISNSSRITIANSGVYNIQFSAQIESSAGADSVYIWFKKNGVNIADSATKVVLANNTAQTMTVNILQQASANDYFELVWQSANGNARIISEPASGNIPLIPAVIATVTQVR